MKVLVPIKNRSDVYHKNLFRAPLFALYNIDSSEHNVYCTLKDIIKNPYSIAENNTQLPSDKHGICNPENCTIEHMNDHIVLSQYINDCDYILGVHFCENILQALNDKGVNIYKISPFLHSSDIAIKNFLLGVSFANTIQNIHFRT